MAASADAPEVNVPALIDQQKVGWFQIRVAILCAAVVFMDGFDAQAIGYVAPTLSKAWNLKPGELGPVFSAGLFGLMLGALAFSPLADRIGRKPVILVCTVWFGIASLLTVTAESTTSLLLSRFIAPEEHPEGFPVRHLFTEGRAAASILIWVMFFTNLLVIYFCANWLPTVINNTGISVRLAVITTALFQVGGIVGTLVLAALIERFGPYRVLAGAYFAAAILIAAIGQAGSTIELVIPAVFGAGFCVVGAQIGANALTATFYPTFIRSTGVGWALGIGRIGSIIGPLLGGMMLSLQWHIPTIFLAGAVPVLIAGIAVFSLGRLTRSAPREPAAVPAT